MCLRCLSLWHVLFSLLFQLMLRPVTVAPTCARNRACCTSTRKAGSVSMARCSRVRSRTEANYSTKWTWAPEGRSCKLAVHGTKLHQKNPCSVSLLLGFHFGLIWMSLMLRTFDPKNWYTACLCYSVFDVDVADRSCAARKGRVCFLWSFLGQSRQIPQERKNVHTQIRSKRPVDTMTQCVFAIRFALCQVLNLWSATYTWGWVSLSRYHVLAIVHCLLLHVCLFDCLLLVCCFEANVRCARCSKITFVLRG